MAVGEEREQRAEALPAERALQLNASRLAETLLYYSEVPLHKQFVRMYRSAIN